MPCVRNARFRHNTIAFWLSDEEKKTVEARIILSGLQKGEYYRRSVLGQEIHVIAGNYMSVRVAKALEEILKFIQDGYVVSDTPLAELIKELLEINNEILTNINKGIDFDQKGNSK